MMARPSMQRSSTLIDPESLKRPASTMLPLVSSQSTPGIGPEGLTRRNSAHAKTLINFDDEIPGAPRGSFLATDKRGGGMSNTRSVFGVDTIWERELAKLWEKGRSRARPEERKELVRDTTVCSHPEYEFPKGRRPSKNFLKLVGGHFDSRNAEEGEVVRIKEECVKPCMIWARGKDGEPLQGGRL